MLVKAYPAEAADAFLDGQESDFPRLGEMAQTILYDNTKITVAQIIGDGKRKRN